MTFFLDDEERDDAILELRRRVTRLEREGDE